MCVKLGQEIDGGNKVEIADKFSNFECERDAKMVGLKEPIKVVGKKDGFSVVSGRLRVQK